MSTDLEDRLGAALRARAAQLTVDPAHLDPSSVTGRTRTGHHMGAWLAVAASVVAVALIAAGVLVFGRHNSTRPATPPAPSVPTGTITGTLAISGGPPLIGSVGPRPIPDFVVTAYRGDSNYTDAVAQVRTGRDGHFTLHVPPGSYVLGSEGIIYDPPLGRPACISDGGSFVVASGAIVDRDVVCEEK